MVKKTRKDTLRSAFLWLHRWLGLVSGIVIVVVALTGTLYVFEEEGRDLFQRKYFYVTPAATPRKPLQEISAVVKQQFPKETITQIRFREKADAAIVYHTKSEKAISVNPYTLQVVGTRNLKHDFFNTVLDIHLHLLMGKFGEQVVKWNVLIFFIMCISGLIIWWPRQKRFLKQAVTIKFKTKNRKRLNWDLHSVLGFYALFVLLIISFTGMFWVFDSVKSAVSKITGAPVTKNEKTVSTFVKGGSQYTVEAAYYAATEMEPGASQVFISSNPGDSLAPVRVLFRYPYTIVRKQNTFFFDKYSGQLLKADLFKNYTAYDNVSRSNYDFHTGRIRVLGIGSKIVYFLAGLFATSLPITGFLVWWGRRKKKPVTRNYKRPAGLKLALANE
jgi:uncharacterized iron-regulated membrane protein